MRTGASTDAIPREATDGRAARATTGRSWAGKARAERSAPSDGAPAAHAGMSRPRGARDGHATARANVDLDVPGLQPYVEAATATRARLCVLSGDAAPAAAVGRCRGPRTANGGARSSADPAVRSCASRTIAPRAWKPSWKRTTAGLRSSRTASSRRTRRSWVDIRDRATGCNAARHRWCALQAGGRRFETGWLHCLEVPAIGVF
jgi:hypothetical protein